MTSWAVPMSKMCIRDSTCTVTRPASCLPRAARSSLCWASPTVWKATTRCSDVYKRQRFFLRCYTELDDVRFVVRRVVVLGIAKGRLNIRFGHCTSCLFDNSSVKLCKHDTPLLFAPSGANHEQGLGWDRVCEAQRSNESPSGAFKRQRGLRQQMEGRGPDKRYPNKITSEMQTHCRSEVPDGQKFFKN